MMWGRPAVRKKLKLTVKCSKSIALTHCPPRSPLGFFHPGFKFTVLGSPNQGVLSKCLRRCPCQCAQPLGTCIQR